MYEPAPPRPKKTNIVRSRSGCKNCRLRRVKCDEKKPSCNACIRHGKTCEMTSSNFEFRTGSVLAGESQGVRYPKQSKVVCSQSPQIQQRATSDNVNESHDSILKDATDDPRLGEADDASPSRMTRLEQIPSPSCESSSQLQVSAPSCSSPLVNPILSRLLDRSASENFYLTYWERSCAPSLPRCLRRITTVTDDRIPVMQALLALSACNLSRSSPESEFEISSSQIKYRPQRESLLSSQYYYGSAIKRIAKSISKNDPRSPSHTLAVLVLFCYLESAMGNFAGFGCHAQGINTFIRVNFEALSSDSLSRGLTAAWILAERHTWWLRMHFSPFKFQISQQSLCLSVELSDILYSIKARRPIVTSILCESYRINTIGFLQMVPRLEIHGKENDQPSVDECITSLRTESSKLDEWHSSLPQSELPVESYHSFEIPGQGTIHPLFFQSHEFAMNYAYYVSSRIMQCTTFLYSITSPHYHMSEVNEKGAHGEEEEEEEEVIHWMKLLLRIAAGLDKQSSDRENVYSIGISSLLVACLLRCHNQDFGEWVEGWLHEWKSSSILEEGSFPISQSLEITRLINEQRESGKDVYGIGLPDDDGGGMGKYASYVSQHIDKVVLVGRERDSGGLYSEISTLKKEIRDIS